MVRNTSLVDLRNFLRGVLRGVKLLVVKPLVVKPLVVKPVVVKPLVVMEAKRELDSRMKTTKYHMDRAHTN